ncbi:MAG: hypothetical protein ABIR94_03680, partial [Rubrivivax sp.]
AGVAAAAVADAAVLKAGAAKAEVRRAAAARAARRATAAARAVTVRAPMRDRKARAHATQGPKALNAALAANVRTIVDRHAPSARPTPQRSSPMRSTPEPSIRHVPKANATVSAGAAAAGVADATAMPQGPMQAR